MGKCKRRTLRRSDTTFFMTREEAVNNVFRTFKQPSKSFDLKSAIKTISLFGLSAEELSEAGIAYENLKALGSAIN